MTIIWILFGLIEVSVCASIAENAQLVGLIGYFMQPTDPNAANFNMFPGPIVFYPILQRPASPYYILPSAREPIEAAEQNTDRIDIVTDVTDKIDETTTQSGHIDDIPPINLLPLGESPSEGLLKPPPPPPTPSSSMSDLQPPTITLSTGQYGYPNSNQNINSISFTTSYPGGGGTVYPLNIPSQLFQFRPSPVQTNHFNQFRPSIYGFGLPDGNTNFITGRSRLDNFPIDIATD